MRRLEKKLVKFGLRLGLSRIRKALAAWGDPQKRLRVILVAGTNGKGSVTAYIARVLQAAGYRVGSYYSPHLVRYNERWQINGKEMPDKKMREYEKKALVLVQKYPLTLFEALTVVTYQYFADARCDFAVMEIGMGGRLDATNVAEEELGIIASVGLDHTRHLGKTLAKIAYEKAGILKQGKGIIGAIPDAVARAKISQEAKKRNVPLHWLGKNFTYTLKEATTMHTRFDYSGKHTYRYLQTRLLGNYQAMNAALAVKAAEGLGIKEHAIREGLKMAQLPGRLQVLRRRPWVVVDGAHNLPGMQQLVENLNLFRYERLHILFGAMREKDWKGMLDLIAPKANMILTTQPSNPRAENPKTLARYAQRYTSARAIPNVKSAFRFALSQTGKNDLLLVCGSLYLAGDVLAFSSKSPKK